MLFSWSSWGHRRAIARLWTAGNVRITENSRLETAAAAIVQRMTSRSSPLVFLPVLPFNKGSSVAAVMMAVVI